MLPGLSPEEQQSLVLSLGTHRKDRQLAPLEASAIAAKARAAGASVRDIARAVGIASPEIVRRLLLLSSLDDSVKPLVAWGHSAGRISFATAAELARLPSREQLTAATAIVEHSISNSEVEELVQMSDRSGGTVEQSIASVLARRPHVERRYLFLGTLAPAAMERLGQLHGSERQALLDLATRTVFGELAKKMSTSSVGPRVSLVSSEDIREALGNDFDRRLSAALEALP